MRTSAFHQIRFVVATFGSNKPDSAPATLPSWLDPPELDADHIVGSLVHLDLVSALLAHEVGDPLDLFLVEAKIGRGRSGGHDLPFSLARSSATLILSLARSAPDGMTLSYLAA